MSNIIGFPDGAGGAGESGEEKRAGVSVFFVSRAFPMRRQSVPSARIPCVPRWTVSVGKTWSFKYAASQEFHDIMAQVIVNAKCLAEELQKYGFRIVSGGTDNHLLVVDLRSKGLTGKTMQNALDAVGITVNKNMIPFDPEKPGVTSGIRIGLTAVSQRGLKEPEIREIAAIINQVAEAPEDEANLKACKAKAEALIAKFPLYPAGSFDD